MKIKTLLTLDAATCALMAAVLLIGSPVLSGLLLLPASLLYIAGVALLPIALFMAIVAKMQPIPDLGCRAVVAGNGAWVLASIFVIAHYQPNVFGTVFVLVQTLVVLAFAILEFMASMHQRATA